MKKSIQLILAALLYVGLANAQEKTSMNVKDLDSDIDKYVSKNYEGFKITEAFKYDQVYEMTIQRDSVKEKLVFSSNSKFLYKKTEADKAKVSLQTRTTMSLDDVESDVTKYIKKNYVGYKLTEAFRYDEVYTTKIVRGAETQMLLFDKEGKFVKKVEAKQPAPPAKKDTLATKTDTVPVIAPAAEPAKTDSVK